MTTAISASTPDLGWLIDRPTLVVARRDPLLPAERDDPVQFATRVLEAAVADGELADGAVDFQLPEPLSRRIRRLVRFPDGDQPTMRRDLWDALDLPADGSSREWAHFRRINLGFAAQSAITAPPGGAVMVIANGLYLVPQQLRRLRSDVTIILVVLEELPSLRSLVEGPAAAPLMCGMLGADILWSATEAEACRFEVAAVALNLAEPSGRSIMHRGRAIELRAG